MQIACLVPFRPLAPVCRLHLNEPFGHGIDPGVSACPTTSENQYMLASMINDGELNIVIVGRSRDRQPHSLNIAKVHDHALIQVNPSGA